MLEATSKHVAGEGGSAAVAAEYATPAAHADLSASCAAAAMKAPVVLRTACGGGRSRSSARDATTACQCRSERRMCARQL